MEDIRAELERKTPRSREALERSSEVLAQLALGTLPMSHPIYIRESKGSRVTDVDGNEYIDLAMGFGPHMLRHAPDVVVDAVKEAVERGTQWALHNPYQEKLARLLVEASPCAEKVVFCNSGTESTMYAIRAARAYTGKSKIAVFEGSYHGAHDSILGDLDPASPPDAPTFRPRGAGVPAETLQNVMMLPYRRDAAFDLIREHRDELALVLLELSARPDAGNLTLIGVGEDEFVEPDEYNQGVDMPVVEETFANLAGRMPGMSQALFRGGWSGLFTTTPDWHPILDRVEGVDGLYCAVGFSGHGFKLSPVVGVAMAEMITEGEASTVDVSMLDLARFREGRTLGSRYRVSVLG